MKTPKINLMLIVIGLIAAISSFVGIFLVCVRAYDHAPWNPDALLLFIGVFVFSVAYLIRKRKTCTP